MESFFVLGHLNTLVELELAFEASIVSLRIFGNETKHGRYRTKRNKVAERRKKRRPEDCLIH
ncbi:hypothetical protein H5410_027417 [Solanum commersonii]|uniref:Uncharacterized protein n=1 Tax=Solanum commersonii TaxID=4109 RepID=A0A9J5Z179_SOLCO|nr:hypothetical protein H5410_027417 [Solanum commersonii]